MNNDLEQFSEERLEEIIECSELNDNSEIAALARIALASKQAKPVAWEVKGILCHTKEEADIFIGEPEPLYDTPQPAHTEQEITDNVRDALEKALNAMQFMGDTLNNLDAVCAEDVEHVTPAFEAIRKLLAAAPKPESE